MKRRSIDLFASLIVLIIIFSFIIPFSLAIILPAPPPVPPPSSEAGLPQEPPEAGIDETPEDAYVPGVDESPYTPDVPSDYGGFGANTGNGTDIGTNAGAGSGSGSGSGSSTGNSNATATVTAISGNQNNETVISDEFVQEEPVIEQPRTIAETQYKGTSESFSLAGILEPENTQAPANKSLLPWMILGITLILIAGGSAGAFIYLQGKNKEEEQKVAPLKEYIEKSKACGFEESKIREAAKSQGWEEKDLKFAFGH